MQLCNRLLGIIRRKGDIHGYDLLDEAGISINQYNVIKPYFTMRFAEWVKYDKATKMWSLVASAQVEQKQLEDEVKEEMK